MAYGQLWIRQFCVMNGVAPVLDKDEQSFGVLYNVGVRTTVRADGIAYELNKGELMFLTPYLSVELCPESKRTELLFLEFYLDGRMTMLPDETVKELLLRFQNFFSLRQKASAEAVRLFDFLRHRNSTKDLLGDACYAAAVILLLTEFMQSNLYIHRKGANWNVYNADGWAQYLENHGSDVVLCLRLDYRDRHGTLHMAGTRTPLLLDGQGVVQPLLKPIESCSFLLPKGFRGTLYLPFLPDFRLLDETIDAEADWFLPDFHEMTRLLYYFYLFDERGRVPLKGTEDVRLGAMRLVNAVPADNGVLVLNTVRSLSYAAPFDSETCHLSPQHMGTIFNRQYYYPQGMRISFADGLIRLHQETAGGFPFVCTNMGCDATLVPDYPPDIARAVEHIRAHPRQLHTVSELAQIAFLSESRFKEKFRRAVGVSPIQFAENVRIHEACLLLRTDRSVTDVAFDLGYSSTAHFSAAFRRAMGTTPGRYRRVLPQNAFYTAVPR